MKDPAPEYTDNSTEEIKKVCDNFGYGNVMSTASALWQKKLDYRSGGAYSVGPCIASLVDCGCSGKFKEKCHWCSGTGKLTKHVKQVKDDMTNKKPESPEEIYEICRTMVVSQYHISKMDVEGIEHNGDKTTVDEKHPFKIKVKRFERGYIMFVDTKMVLPYYKGYSPAFKHLIKLAKKNNCQYIQLDSDGPQYDGLVIFTW